MNYKNLSNFIKVLEAEQELIRINKPVSSHFEITEITDRVSKSKGGGKALLFEQVEGSIFAVLTNAFGSEKRIALSLGGETLEQIGERLKELLEPELPKSLRDKFRLLKRAFSLSRCLPRIKKMACPPCQEVIIRGEEVDLAKLPVLHSWPNDGGPFITFPVVFTRSLTTGKRNAGMYRLQVFDRNTTGMHWHTHKDGAHFFREYEREGKRMEAAVAIGTDPVITYAATSPLPRGMDEMLFAGFIRRKSITLVPAVTVDLEVPAEAEIILEGYIDPDERRLEGPFGDHTGYYSLPDLYPVFHVTAVTHRKNAIYSTTVVGRPPMEDCYLAHATERIFLPLLRTVLPEIRNYRLPWEGVFHNIAVIAIDKEYPGQAWKVVHGIWGTGQMSFSKAVIVVDANVPLYDGATLLQNILSRIDLSRDVLISEGILDALDHSAPFALFGGKIGIDATSRIEGEPQRKEALIDKASLPDRDILGKLKVIDEDFVGCRVFFTGRGLPIIIFQIHKRPEKRGAFFRSILLSSHAILRGIVLFFDAETDIHDDSLILWKGFNNVDPLRDIVINEDLMIIDATQKSHLDGHQRSWPEDVTSGEEIKRQVDLRLEELGIGYLLKK